MNTLWKQALIAAALGTAVTAGAQYTSPPASSPGATPDPSPMTKPATGAATSSPQDRMPANRDQEATKACANTPASEREACIAREKARNPDTKSPMSSGSSTTTPGLEQPGGAEPGRRAAVTPAAAMAPATAPVARRAAEPAPRSKTSR